jgi:C-terminal processing protease CtpA/Prc
MLNGHFMVGRHLGCAVPINQIRAVLPQLKRGIREDDLARGWLGFSVLSDPANTKTIEISRVDEDSPASKAGLEAGWHITRVDNYVIPSHGWLREMLGVSPLTRDIRTPARGPFSPPGERTVWVSYGMPVGTFLQLTVRNPESGDEKTVSLKVAERTEDF